MKKIFVTSYPPTHLAIFETIITEISQKKDQFLTYISVEKNLSTHTIRAYESDLTQFLEFWLNLSAALNQSSEICLTAEKFWVARYANDLSELGIPVL